MGFFDFLNKKEETTPNETFDLNNFSFIMEIDDVFTVTGKGIYATGTIDIGVVNLGDQVKIVDSRGGMITTTIQGIEMFKRQLMSAREGDSVGLLLKDVTRTDVFPGQHIVK